MNKKNLNQREDVKGGQYSFLWDYWRSSYIWQYWD